MRKRAFYTTGAEYTFLRQLKASDLLSASDLAVPLVRTYPEEISDVV